MSKALSLSQQQTLLILIERSQAAQQNVKAFLEYLRDEHGAPESAGWALLDVQQGFQQVTAPQEESNGALS